MCRQTNVMQGGELKLQEARKPHREERGREREEMPMHTMQSFCTA